MDVSSPAFSLSLAVDGKTSEDVFRIVENDRKFDFISNGTWDTIANGKLRRALQNLATEETMLIWKRLIIDAVHFLRINDARERAFLIERTNSPNDFCLSNKTKLDSEDAEQTASLNTYGIEELESYFTEFQAFESALYGIDHYYRDHIQHPMRVWLVGINILKTCAPYFCYRASKEVSSYENSFADPTKDQFKYLESPDADAPVQALEISSAELMAMWTIIALTHDLGYPLEKVERINDCLERMLHQFGTIGFQRSEFTFRSQNDHLIEHLLRIISSNLVRTEKPCHKPWRTHLRSKYFAKFSKSWENFDHGIASSLILLRCLTFFLETDLSSDGVSNLDNEDARQFVIRSEILHAIATHTTPKVYHLCANTLPFLLILCDDLQEWGRPTFADLRQGSLCGDAKEVRIEHLEITNEKSEIHCVITYDDGSLSITDQMKRTFRVFKSWHERLRPAIEDTKRQICFAWKIGFKDDLFWEFKIDNNAPVFQQVTVWGPSRTDPPTRIEYQLYEEKPKS